MYRLLYFILLFLISSCATINGTSFSHIDEQVLKKNYPSLYTLYINKVINIYRLDLKHNKVSYKFNILSKDKEEFILKHYFPDIYDRKHYVDIKGLKLSLDDDYNIVCKVIMKKKENPFTNPLLRANYNMRSNGVMLMDRTKVIEL